MHARAFAIDAAPFNCRLCDGARLQLYYSQGNEGQFKYYKCARCGLVNLDLAKGLDQEQYTEEFIDPRQDDGRGHRAIDASFEFLRRFVSTPGKLLDIGCGSGRLLHVARRAGWEVKGIELSEWLAASVAEALGVEVVAGNFLDMKPEAQDWARFDVVCLRHVLEHLPDSKLALSKIRALLRPDGHLLLEMPNIEGLDKRFKRLLTSAGLHTRTYPEHFVAGHCNEFSRKSLEYLLRVTGFRLIRWETYSKKPLSNWLYTHVHIGNKARALVQRIDV